MKLIVRNFLNNYFKQIFWFVFFIYGYVNTGDIVKRGIFLFFLLFLCFISSKTADYSYLINDDSYKVYTLSIDNLNTKNFSDYFSDINIIGIYPSINPVYKKGIGDLYYKFSGANNSFEIDSFVEKYLSFVKKNSYSDYNYLYINGIGIDKIDIYTSGNDLYNFISNNKNLLINIME